MNDERLRSHGNSTRTSRLSRYSERHFDYFDTHHSVFSRNSYYHDMRSVHPLNRRPCSKISGISLSTLRARSCSTRLDELARPKIKRERLVRQEVIDNTTNYAYSGVKSSALTAQCSDRLSALAQPKKNPIGYIGEDTLPKVVAEQALHAHVSDRVSELAKPRQNILLLNAAWKNKQN